MVVSSYLVLQWIHLALLVRVGGTLFREDFISGSVNLKLGAPRFSGYLQIFWLHALVDTSRFFGGRPSKQAARAATAI